MRVVMPTIGRLHQSIAIGELYETSIAQAFFSDRAWDYARSSARDNWGSHFDYVVRKGDHMFNVEIKSPKKCRVPSAENQFLILLEHTGITGKPGWLQGKAHFIMQFLSETRMLCYHRGQALDTYGLIPTNIPRCSATNAPISQWFGREGLSRKGLPNQDIIRWEPLGGFCSQVTQHGFYIKIDGKWQKQ